MEAIKCSTGLLVFAHLNTFAVIMDQQKIISTYSHAMSWSKWFSLQDILGRLFWAVDPHKEGILLKVANRPDTGPIERVLAMYFQHTLNKSDPVVGAPNRIC